VYGIRKTLRSRCSNNPYISYICDRMQKDDGRVVSNFINQALMDEPDYSYGDGNKRGHFVCR